jgi:scyllo-inositol 2-dehydrogenase (NADP+)
MEKIRVGIVGFGVSGAVFHAPFIANHRAYALKYIVTRQQEKAKQIAEIYPQVQVLEDAADLFARNDVDLVIISVPHAQHYALTRDALQASKHVLVEKPFVIHSDEGRKLAALAIEKKKVLSVYHNRRFDDGFLSLKSLLKENRLGDIMLYQAFFDRYRPEVNLSRWREQDGPGNGILYDLGSHLVDGALHLFGRPEAVFCDLDIQRPQAQSVDYFRITMRYKKMRVELGSSSMVARPRPVCAAYGSIGSFVKYGLDPQEDALRVGRMPTGSPTGAHTGSEWGGGSEEYFPYLSLRDGDKGVRTSRVPGLRGDYGSFYQGLARAIVEGSAPPVTAQEGVDVISVLESCLKSDEAKSWVEMP